MGTIMEQLANVEPRERYRSLGMILRDRYEKAGLPLVATLELTPHCTLDCKMCYVHRSDGKYSHRVLTGDEWIDIIDQAKNMGVLYVVMTGGECLLHPEFKRIYTHARHQGMIVTVLTNGTLIDENVLELFKAFPPRKVQVSVYGSNPSVYKAVTGSAEAFYAVDKALTQLQQAGVITDIQLTISKYNYCDFDNLWAYVRAKTNGYINVECDLFESLDNCENSYSQYALSFEEQYNIQKRTMELRGRSAVDLLEDDFLECSKDIVVGYPERIPCAAGMCLFLIRYFGEMFPCNNFPLASANVLENGVLAAWTIVNRATKAYRRSQECLECDYFGKCHFCAGRYASATGGKNGMRGTLACDKKQHMLLPLLYKKSRFTNIKE